MTFRDWVRMSRELYREEDVLTATKRSLMGLRNGAFRRVGAHLGRSIWARGDWDVLVVLDACRSDLWDEVAPEYGLPTGETVYSNASCSIDWIERNLTGRPELPRTGYVTANPFADHDTDSARSADLGDGDLGYFRPLYKTHWAELCDGQIATVPPDVVTDHAIAAWRERERLGIDRLVVHYMQPHEPYRARPEWGSGDSKLLSNLIDDDKEAGSSVWARIEAGEIDRDEFWAVYQDNLRWVLDDVDGRLLGNVDGEVVLTADHGNALGEWGEWHHPPGAIGPAVRRVPWIAVHSADQRDVTPGVDVRETGVQNRHDADAQLDALGYV